MSSHLRVKCPGCQATLQIAAEMRGRQMACPKCQMRFRLPEPVVKPDLPPMALPVSAEPQNESPWEEVGGFPSSPQAGNFHGSANFQPQPQYSQPQYPQQQYSAPQQYSGSPQYVAPKRMDLSGGAQRGVGGEDEELSEADSNLQSTGIFLVVVPILAAILPLFGLQLRRLARAGEFAPIGAMILGFVGAGIIVYARRKRSDAPMAGAAAAVITLVFGVGGFLLQSGGFEPENAQQAAGRREVDATNNIQPISPEEMERRRAEQERRSRELQEKVRRNLDEAEKWRNEQPAALPTNFGPPSTPPNFGSVKPNSDSIDSSDPFTNSPNNPFHTSTPSGASQGHLHASQGQPERLEQSPSEMGQLLRLYSQGKSQFSRQRFQSAKTLTFENLVGIEGPQGRLYAEEPVVGVCGCTIGRDLALVPISADDSSLKYTVIPATGELLAGLRFAFEGDSIVGYQGLLRSAQGSQPRETEWFGEQTGDVKESMNPSPGNTGMVCYTQQGKFCGFAWVEL